MAKNATIRALNARLELIRSRVEGLPDHPWIPGACFDDELLEAMGLPY